MNPLVRRPTLFMLATWVGIGALCSCQRKIGVDMQAIGDNHAAENRQPPVVLLVSSTAPSGKYVTGDSIAITVQFSKPVHVEGAGHITLALATGAATREASYQSGSDSDTLGLIYQVQRGDHSDDLQYTGVDALSCSADTSMRDEVDNDAVLTLPELSSAQSLGEQKHFIINPVASSPIVYEDMGIHFEKTNYQTRSIKRLLIKESEVAGMSRATVLVNSKPLQCTVDSVYAAALALASLEPVMTINLNAALMKTPCSTLQNVTLALSGTGIAPNETTEQLTLKDFYMSDLGSASLDRGVQIKDGYQGWIGPLMGASRAADGESYLISGYFHAINH